MVEHIEYPWALDKEKLHEDVKAWCQSHKLTLDEGMEMCGLSRTWSYPSAHTGGPTVANLLMVCSLMDLDPREYFTLTLP